MFQTAVRAARQTVSLRRSLKHRPSQYELQRKDPVTLRRIVIQAPGPSDSDRQQWEIIEAGPSEPGPSRSRHPFADHLDPSSEPAATPLPPPDDSNPEATSQGGTSITTHTSLPSPPQSVQPTLPLHLQHPFDTHAFVSYLEKHDVPLGTARILMEGVRKLIVSRGEVTRESMLGREDMENGAYLFRAALSELRTELSVRARNDGAALKAMSGAIRREVDQLEQKMKEDVLTLKHDVEMDMNNRKADTRTDIKGFDMAIEEINNKFTISLGDLRTEIESAKWDSTRRAISIIILVVVFGVAVTMYNTMPATTPASTTTASSSTNTREMGVGTDDYLADDEPLTDEKLEKLLRDRGVGEIPVKIKPITKADQKEMRIDRI